MLRAAPRIEPESARRLLSPRPGWLAQRRRRSAALASKRLPHLELVWLPFLRVTADDGRQCVVCATTGLSARLGSVEMHRGDSTGVPGPALANDRLLEIARGHLGRIAAAVGRRGHREPVLEHEEIALPFWVLLYERRRGRLDFRALDATSGAKAGGAVRQAIVRALVASASPATGTSDA